MARRTGHRNQCGGLSKIRRAQPGGLCPHAPQASFGDQEFYPDLIDKAAVLACHVAWNHPLPDGNKRVSWACLVAFLDLNGVVWDPDPPDVDEAESAVIAMAAHEVDEAWMATWLRERTRRVEQ